MIAAKVFPSIVRSISFDSARPAKVRSFANRKPCAWKALSDGSWWEYCCDCGTFLPAKTENGYLRRSECLVCERPTTRRYICPGCQVVGIESASVVHRKQYSILDESGISPNCPGCAATAKARPVAHECSEISAAIMTTRSSCPFCETVLPAHESASTQIGAPDLCPFCQAAKPDGEFCDRCGKRIPTQVGWETDRQEKFAAPGPSHPMRSRFVSGDDLHTTVDPEANDLTDDFAEVVAERDPVSPSWETNLPGIPPKRSVRLLPVISGVAISLVVVFVFAIVVNQKRKSPALLIAATPAAPAGMTYVAATQFMMGNNGGDEYEKPAHNVTIKAFLSTRRKLHAANMKSL